MQLYHVDIEATCISTGFFVGSIKCVEKSSVAKDYLKILTNIKDYIMLFTDGVVFSLW